jgi:hypothetical protein
MSYDAEVMDWQRALKTAGYDLVVDGDFGPKTLAASLNSLGTVPPTVPTEPSGDLDEIPGAWLPPSSKMRRIIAHWTAGSYAVSATDREHYHFIWAGDGKVELGDHAVTDNEGTLDGDYAAHTKRCNTGSIGVSMACMAGARESPFYAGDYEMTRDQWNGMVRGIAQLCLFYDIPLDRMTVLSHAEVEGTLGIDQAGKWDFTRIPFMPELIGAKACGDHLRECVGDVMDSL